MGTNQPMTGQQLLAWLVKQSHKDLQRPVGFVGIYGEFAPITELPALVKAKASFSNEDEINVIRVQHLDVGAI